MPKELPSPELLRKLLRYEPETGKLYWRVRTKEVCDDDRSRKTFNSQFSGREAMSNVTHHGYARGTLFSKSHTAHRVAWAIYYGEWPPEQIDHINGNRLDNRIANLRSVNDSENRKNMAIRSDNTTGVLGVHWYKSKNLWHAQIQVNEKKVHLGYFERLEDAAKARRDAEAQYGFHVNHGRAKPQSK